MRLNLITPLLCLSLLGLSSISLANPDPEVFEDPETAPRPARSPVTPEPSGPGEERIDLETLFPTDGRVFGWKKMYPESTGMGPSGMFNWLGPGTELYLEYGIEELRVLDYERGEGEIAIELFRSSTSEGAFGLYSIFNAFSGNERPVLTNVQAVSQEPSGDIKLGEVRATGKPPPMQGDNYRIWPQQGAEFYKGRVYGRIRVAGPIEDIHMLALTTTILEKIPRDAPRPPILRSLPKPGMLANSIRFVVGPLSVQELHFPIPAELWGVTGSARAATARYRLSEGNYYDVLVVQYPSVALAAAKLNAIREFFNGDPGLRPFPTSPRITVPVFIAREEATEKFVAVRHDSDRLFLYANVANAPLFEKIINQNPNISVTHAP